MRASFGGGDRGYFGGRRGGQPSKLAQREQTRDYGGNERGALGPVPTGRGQDEIRLFDLGVRQLPRGESGRINTGAAEQCCRMFLNRLADQRSGAGTCHVECFRVSAQA